MKDSAARKKIRNNKIAIRILSLLLACGLLLSLSACGGQKMRKIEAVTRVREPEPQALQTASEATALTLRQYIYARLLTEAFLAADASAMTMEELSNLSDALLLAWESTELFSFAASALTGQAVLLLETPTVEQTAAVGHPKTGFMTLAAAPIAFQAPALAAKAGRTLDPQTWAENLTKQYDALRGAKRYQQLAEQLGTDARTAYEQMVLAQKIIRNAAELEEAEAVVNAWTESINYLQGVKTTSKVAMLGWSMAATGGGSVGLLEGAGLLVGGVDCIVDIAETGSTIILGENSQAAVAFGDIKETLGPVSSLVGLVTLNPSEVGKTAKDTAEALVYITDSLVDLFYEDKIVGVKVEGLSEQAVRISGQILETGAKAALETAGFLYPETTKIVSELVDFWKPNPETALARMDALISQMAELMQAAGLPDEAAPEPDALEGVLPPVAAGDINIFGRYTCVISYADGETETQTISILDRGDGSVVWTDFEGDETILSYDKSSHTLYLEGVFTVNITFSDSGGNVTGSGYENGVLWGEPFHVDFSLTKLSD